VSERTARLDQLLRQEISAIVSREVDDPRIGFVTITDVEVASDLRHATVWVSIIGADAERRETMRVLGRAMPFVRHQLGKLHLKRIPELHLREDRTAERGTRILRLLDELEGGAPPTEADAAAETVVPTESLPTPTGRAPVEPRAKRRPRRTGSDADRRRAPRGRR
jgi:ribosome-binding factor A